MQNIHKNYLRYIVCAVGIILSSCQSTTNTAALPKARETVRVSDEYSLSKVATYEVFEWPVSQHCMAMITLKSGRKLPMLCRRQPSSIYPIPQSVFATDDPTRFSIMCEPLIIKGGVDTYKLMRLSVVADFQCLSDGNQKALKISPVPKLIESPRFSF